MTFASLGLSEPIIKAIIEQGYSEPYPVQIQAIPAILTGSDIAGIAQTGSGKTASFVLPILENFQRKSPNRTFHARVLVLVPTRELAMQIAEVIGNFSKNLPNRVKSMAIFGGVSLNQQMQHLKNTEILVATPGRLLELISVNALSLAKIEILVLDESDKMLDLAFQDEINQLLALLPAQRQNILFSATVNAKSKLMADKLLHNPVEIVIEPDQKYSDLIQQVAYLVEPSKKGPLLRYIIKIENMEQVLVFVSSVRTADNLTAKLKKNGIDALAIHSQKSQGARIQALQDFKKGNIRVLVATDLASRGIDIHLLPVVINFDLPRSPKDYIHRIGRTGRAEVSGRAISLICLEDQHHFKIIQKKMKKQVEIINSEAFILTGM